MIKVSAKINTWNKATHWDKLIEQTAMATRLTAEEKAILSCNLAAEVIAATAYISECKDPDRITVAHLTTLVAGIRCPDLYGYRDRESLADRLTAGNYYPGGNQEVVKAGMLILELISLNDHRADFEQDLIKGKANPLAVNVNYDQARKKIEKEFAQLTLKVQEIYQEFYKSAVLGWGWTP